LLDRLTTQQKLDVLKELIFYKFANDKPKMISDIDQWFIKAAKTKVAINRYCNKISRLSLKAGFLFWVQIGCKIKHDIIRFKHPIR